MLLEEIRKKLEFDSVINAAEKFISSELGKERMHQVPFYTDRISINESLSLVSEMKEFVAVEGELDLSLLRDVRLFIEHARIKGKFLSPEKILWILDFLLLSRYIKTRFTSGKREYIEKYGRLYSIIDGLFHDKILEHNIEITIDINGEVKDNASSALKKLREEIRTKKEILRKKLLKILKHFSEEDILRDDIITLRDGRSVIPVRVENKRKIKGIIHSSSATGATIFIEPDETIELNNDLTELGFAENKEIEKILLNLTEQISGCCRELKNNCEILSEIDFLQAKAKYALKINAVLPVITESEIILKNAYHPALLENTQKGFSAVPLSVNIGQKYNTLIVTGPNAGGKTVALKTFGLSQMMFQSGFLLPCEDSSSFRVFEKIFVNIGDDQSIADNLSTFSSHLKSMKEILDEADDKSLILIDEICAGTDPTLGAALSCSILKSLSEKNSITLVTTHIGDLKIFAYNTSKIENASLEFDYETLSPSFNLVTGIPGQSYTFEIARKFRLPDEIIEGSKLLLQNRETDIEDLIKQLNANKQMYERLKNEFNLKNSRLNALIKMYNERVSEIKAKEKTFIDNAKAEAENILDRANKLMEKTIREIRENTAAKPKEIKEKFESEKMMIIKKEETVPEEPDKILKLKVGDSVALKGSSGAGEIAEIKGESAVVNFNGISVKVNIKELVKAEGTSTYTGTYYSNVVYNQMNNESSLDLRGRYTSDIKDIIEVFINNANIHSLKMIKIIHGKGSGKLREKVNMILKNNQYVESFRPGNWNEGDFGVTIVNLKE